MEKDTDSMSMLDLITRPAFCVKGGQIVRVNQAAECRQIQPDTKISELISSGTEEYDALTDGCLYLTLNLSDCPCGASVTRQPDFDVFILEDENDQAELNAMALAAQELREPLSNIMSVSAQLFSDAENPDEKQQDQMACINRGLYQMLRLLGNMSDASRYASDAASHFEVRNITAMLDEIFTHSRIFVEKAGISLHFQNISEDVYCLADTQKIERAIQNILSNSLRFTPEGGSIDAKLTRRKNKLHLTVSDTGEGIPESMQKNIFSRYLRQPTVEDGRYGIGLGTVLIRAAAAAHGGTVLLEQPEDSGLRITLSMTIRQGNSQLLHSGMLKVDYAGELDHNLVELSDSLPTSLYSPKELK